jgi:hypothetical protein
LANVAAVPSANVIDRIAKKLGLEVVDVRGRLQAIRLSAPLRARVLRG